MIPPSDTHVLILISVDYRPLNLDCSSDLVGHLLRIVRCEGDGWSVSCVQSWLEAAPRPDIETGRARKRELPTTHPRIPTTPTTPTTNHPPRPLRQSTHTPL